MSDGNFNRALLPSTPYQSGLKMGKQLGLKQAKEAFSRTIRNHFPTLPEEEIKELEQLFQRELK